MKYALWQKDKIWFSVLMFLGILLSAWLKNDNVYDFQNYHYYNAFAFLHNRLNYDIVPAYINGFYNPIIELPLYFWVQWFNDFPTLIFALQGVWFGLLLIALYKICGLFFDFKQSHERMYALYVFVLCIMCRTVLPQIGSSTNEIMIAGFCLWGVYFLLKMLKYPKLQNKKQFWAAGFLIGMAVGLKPTVVCSAVAGGAMLFMCYKQLSRPLLYIFLFASGGLVGVLLFDGFLMLKYWQLYQNPFFPFLNAVFASDYMQAINYRDDLYKPDIGKIFLYPYIWYINSNYRPNGLLGYAMAVYYSFLLMVLLCFLQKRKLSEFYKRHGLEFALWSFLVIFFFCWLILFSIVRYAAVFEILSLIFCTYMIKTYVKNKVIWGFLLVLLGCSATFFNHYVLDDFRQRQGMKEYVWVERVNLPKNTLVKLYGVKMSFVLPELAKNNIFKALGYYHKCQENEYCHFGKGADVAESGEFFRIRENIEKFHQGATVILYESSSFNPKQTKIKAEDKEHKAYQNCLESQKNNLLSERVNCADLFLNIDNNELRLLKETEDMYCRKLKYNTSNMSIGEIYICVPQNLQDVILQK